jgi:hypothetical protein
LKTRKFDLLGQKALKKSFKLFQFKLLQSFLLSFEKLIVDFIVIFNERFEIFNRVEDNLDECPATLRNISKRLTRYDVRRE